MFIKPLQNYKVRDPILKDHLPAEGRNVDDSPYWQRRIIEGAIEVVAPKAPEETASPKSVATDIDVSHKEETEKQTGAKNSKGSR